MFGFCSRTIVLVILVSSVIGAPIPQVQKQPATNQQGQTPSVGKSAEPSSQASGVFGTTADTPNYQDSPTGVCIVPAFASEAGFGTAKVPLTTEQALQLCPKAARIVVQSQTGKRGTQGAGQGNNVEQPNNQNAQPSGTGSTQPTGSNDNQQGNGEKAPATGNPGSQNGTTDPQTGAGSGSGSSQQGQPISVGKAASPTSQASTVFGTTTESPNFSASPTGVCIVPMFANEAGLGSEKTPLTNEQALELCPNAARIVVCTN